MQTVKQLLDAKGHQIWSIAPDATVFDAIHCMAEKEVGALLVMEGTTMVGIISERDYARKIILQGKASQATRVQEIMTDQVICTHLDQRVEECMALMTEKRIRHLPVLGGESEVVGIISIGDLVKSIIAEQQFVIAQLEHYISG